MNMDDQQWQRQEEQRLAQERAQQAESERQARMEEERQERERERQEREEQDREQRQNAHPGLQDDDTPAHAERSPLKTIWSILFGKRETDAHAPRVREPATASATGPEIEPDTSSVTAPISSASGNASTQFTQAPLGGVQKDKRSRMLLLAVCSALISVGLWWYPVKKADLTFSGAEPSLVGVAPAIPGADRVDATDADLPLPTVEAPPQTDVGSSISVAESLPALEALPADEPAVAVAATVEPASATLTQDAGLPPLAPDMPVVPPVSEASFPTIDERISKLEAGIEEIKQMLMQRSAPVQSRAAPKRKAPRKAAPAKAAPTYNARLLSVDLWDGKPSVVVATDEPGDTRTRVMQPGDTLNGITLREASVTGRSASFDVGNGKLVRLGVESQ